ncbi:alpha/beta fold hydrolase [Roseibium aggregatum]|uniref:Fluoroacetate dehalogenase n=1 Tax=Roseibium aggregatum TaxID=187304 RepID=A0A0M6Y9Z8_9HYPH|nr:alpha/beta hydrolase [Roseibium aggregatum]CTQ46498.1 Fluoroacetate dehalogenase [Roseibium aggregatum]
MNDATNWHLSEEIRTSAGVVMAGRAGEGPSLVLAHGWPWSSWSWHRLIPELSRKFRVHWYDMPGYGQSAKSADQRTSLDIQGKIFAEMLDHWQLERPSVVAHDFGGATTLRAHLLHGCDFEKYVLMNVVALSPWGSEFFDHVGRHVEAFVGLPPHIHRAVVDAYIGSALVNEIGAEARAALADPWLTEEGRGSFYRQFAQADEAYTNEIEPLYDDLRCPVKILWGEDDPWIPIDRGRALHAAIPQSTFETLPNAGHLPQLEVPDLVLAKLGAFL